MAHPKQSEARKDFGDKLARMVGHRGEYPPDRAARIAGPVKGGGKGDAVKEPEEVFVEAPARQVSNYGKVIK